MASGETLFANRNSWPKSVNRVPIGMTGGGGGSANDRRERPARIFASGGCSMLTIALRPETSSQPDRMCTGSSADSESSRAWSRTSSRERKTRAAAARTVAARSRLTPEKGPVSPDSGRFLRRRRLARCRVRCRGRQPRRLRGTRPERVLDESAERGEAVLQPDLLALRLRPPEVGDRHFEDSEPGASHLDGELGVDAEPLRFEVERRNDPPMERLVAGRHVRQVQIGEDVRDQGQEPVSDGVPEELDAPLRAAEETRTIDHVGAARLDRSD